MAFLHIVSRSTQSPVDDYMFCHARPHKFLSKFTEFLDVMLDAILRDGSSNTNPVV